MPQIRLSARAQSDLIRLHKFLREKDPGAANRALLAIKAAMQPLQQSPAIGRLMEDSLSLRELVIDYGSSGYLALYRHEPELNILTVLAIKHQKEDDYR